MVADTRATTHLSLSRPLNQPRFIQVKEDPQGWPHTLYINRKVARITGIQDRWRIDDEWWREEPVSRMYFECSLDDIDLVVIFHDLRTLQWYRQT